MAKVEVEKAEGHAIIVRGVWGNVGSCANLRGAVVGLHVECADGSEGSGDNRALSDHRPCESLAGSHVIDVPENDRALEPHQVGDGIEVKNAFIHVTPEAADKNEVVAKGRYTRSDSL